MIGRAGSPGEEDVVEGRFHKPQEDRTEFLGRRRILLTDPYFHDRHRGFHEKTGQSPIRKLKLFGTRSVIVLSPLDIQPDDISAPRGIDGRCIEAADQLPVRIEQRKNLIGEVVERIEAGGRIVLQKRMVDR